MTVGDFIIERLHAWGVRRIFGYSGDGVNGIIAALDRAAEKIEFVQVRHEEQAAFMACAHAKFTGELGVCVATGGPGAIHLLNGLYDAKADHVPVLALVGQSATFALGAEFQQEVDLQTLFKDVAADYDLTIVDRAQARHAVDRAVRSSLAARAVTALIVPRNVQEMKAVPAPPRKLGSTFSGIGYERPRILPPQSALERAAAVLNAGERVALLVGAGASGATDEIIALAARLQAGCAKALLGKSVVPDDLPWVTGTLGLLGTEASSEMMTHCDTLLLIGTNFPVRDVSPQRRASARRRDRSRRAPDRQSFSYGSKPSRRRAGHDRGSSTAARTENRHALARADRAKSRTFGTHERSARENPRRWAASIPSSSSRRSPNACRMTQSSRRTPGPRRISPPGTCRYDAA